MSKQNESQLVAPMSVRLSFTRGTKNCYRYDSPDPNAAVRCLYVRRSALGLSQPSWIVMHLEPSTAFGAPSLGEAQ